MEVEVEVLQNFLLYGMIHSAALLLSCRIIFYDIAYRYISCQEYSAIPVHVQI